MTWIENREAPRLVKSDHTISHRPGSGP